MADFEFTDLPPDAPQAPAEEAPAAPQPQKWFTLHELADHIGQQEGLPPGLVPLVMNQESNGKANAVSPKGARGLMQLMPGTARALGVDPNSIEGNLRGGARYLKEQLDTFGGNLPLALAAYNAGPNRASLRAGQIPNIPETQNYVKTIMGKVANMIGPSSAEAAGPPPPQFTFTDEPADAPPPTGAPQFTFTDEPTTVGKQSDRGFFGSIAEGVKGAVQGAVARTATPFLKAGTQADVAGYEANPDLWTKAHPGQAPPTALSKEESYNKANANFLQTTGMNPPESPHNFTQYMGQGVGMGAELMAELLATGGATKAGTALSDILAASPRAAQLVGKILPWAIHGATQPTGGAGAEDLGMGTLFSVLPGGRATAGATGLGVGALGSYLHDPEAPLSKHLAAGLVMGIPGYALHGGKGAEPVKPPVEGVVAPEPTYVDGSTGPRGPQWGMDEHSIWFHTPDGQKATLPLDGKPPKGMVELANHLAEIDRIAAAKQAPETPIGPQPSDIAPQILDPNGNVAGSIPNAPDLLNGQGKQLGQFAPQNIVDAQGNQLTPGPGVPAPAPDVLPADVLPPTGAADVNPYTPQPVPGIIPGEQSYGQKLVDRFGNEIPQQGVVNPNPEAQGPPQQPGNLQPQLGGPTAPLLPVADALGAQDQVNPLGQGIPDAVPPVTSNAGDAVLAPQGEVRGAVYQDPLGWWRVAGTDHTFSTEAEATKVAGRISVPAENLTPRLREQVQVTPPGQVGAGRPLSEPFNLQGGRQPMVVDGDGNLMRLDNSGRTTLATLGPDHQWYRPGTDVRFRVSGTNLDLIDDALMQVNPELGQRRFDTRYGTNDPDQLMYSGGPDTRSALDKAKGYATTIGARLRMYWAPETVSQAGAETSAAKKAMLGVVKNNSDLITEYMKQYRERFANFTMEDTKTYMSDVVAKYQRGGLEALTDPQDRDFITAYNRARQPLENQILAMNPDAAMKENYFRQMFYWPEQYDAQGRFIRPPTGFFQKAKYGDWDAAIKAGFLPKFNNPADIVTADLLQKTMYVAREGFLRQMKGDGLIVDGKPGFSDFVKINDTGKWSNMYAPPEVSQIINNYLSAGAADGSIVKLLRNPTAAVNSWKVGFSGFHWVFETISASNFGVGQGLWKATAALVGGDVKGAADALKGAARAVSPDYAYKFYKDGKSLEEQFLKTGLFGCEDLTEPMSYGDMTPEQRVQFMKNQAGVNFRQQSQFDQGVEAAGRTALQNLFADLHSDKIFKGVFTNASHAISEPLMKFYVPRLKLGIGSKLIEAEVGKVDAKYNAIADQRPLTPEESSQWLKDQRGAAQGAWQSVENVWGQLNSDNLNFSNAMKDALHLVIAYPGWNIGSFRTLTGAARGVAQLGKGILSGEGTGAMDQQSKLATQYALGMGINMAIYGSILQYALTGEGPKDLEDVFMPRTGQILASGAPERVRLPSYLKDAFGLWNHPVSTALAKENILMRMAVENINGVDYFGTRFYEPGDNMAMKAAAIAKHSAEQLVMPFSVTQAMNAKTPTTAALGVAGITQAPRELANTEALNIIDRHLQNTMPASRSPEQKEIGDLKAKLRYQAANGNMDDFKAGLRQAVLDNKLTIKQVGNLMEEATKPPIINQFNKVNDLSVSIRAFQAGTPEEQTAWTVPLINKIANAGEDKLHANMAQIQQVFSTIKAEAAARKRQ